MIIPEPNEQMEGVEFEGVHVPQITLFVPENERVSELLGPDGEPLRVGFERPKVGFDIGGRKDG